MKGIWWHRRQLMQAADWFARLRSTQLSDRERAEFEQWVASDPRHLQDYERCQLAWGLAGELEDDPQMRALIDAAAPTRGSHTRRQVLWGAAATILVGAITAGVFLADDEVIYSTAIGEQRSIVLPDQSRMNLNTATEVRVMYKRSHRIVALEHGEATFSVAPDPQRPFEIHAGDGIARALGTEFNVSVLDAGVTVSVLSGTVEVVPKRRAGGGPSAAVLQQGEEVTYQGAMLFDVRDANLNRIHAWHARRISFDDVSLREALLEINRYSSLPVTLGEDSLAELRISGVFRVGEVESLMTALERAFDLRVERTERGFVVWRGSDHATPSSQPI